MHKIEFMISNGQYKRWRRYLMLKWGRGKSLNRMVRLSAQYVVADEIFKEALQSDRRAELAKILAKGEEHGKAEGK